jgi:hypothetical protein
VSTPFGTEVSTPAPTAVACGTEVSAGGRGALLPTTREGRQRTRREPGNGTDAAVTTGSRGQEAPPAVTSSVPVVSGDACTDGVTVGPAVRPESPIVKTAAPTSPEVQDDPTDTLAVEGWELVARALRRARRRPKAHARTRAGAQTPAPHTADVQLVLPFQEVACPRGCDGTVAFDDGVVIHIGPVIMRRVVAGGGVRPPPIAGPSLGAP